MRRRLVDSRANPSRPKLVRPRPGVAQVVLRTLALLRHRYHDLRNLGLEDLVQPTALRAFLEAKVNSSRDSADRLPQSVTVGLHHPRCEPSARRPHNGERAGLRVRVQPNVSIHASPPLRRTVETGLSRTGPIRRLY